MKKTGILTAASMFLCCTFLSALAVAQIPVGSSSSPGFDTLARSGTSNSLTQPTLSPGVLTLMELEGRFSQAVAAGGGKAFGTWFADDAVVLNNGRPAVLGRGNIAAQAAWDPKTYQLTWVPQGAQMGPSNDMGFTWGHYDGRSMDKNGQPVITSGRYFTVWKKIPDGTWKVALDASSNEPPASGECCVLPKP
ncbi:hypothetical protein BH10ACI4_BH10ACI4_27190 [soil metagenome]